MGNIKLKSKKDDNGKWGYVDEAGNWVIESKYDFARDFREGLAAVKLDKKSGFIDHTGKEVIPRIYDEVWDFREGLAAVELDEKYGYIDYAGKMVIPCIFYGAWDFIEGLAKVDLGEKYGYIDQTGKVVIPGIYDDAEDFSKGLASVRLDGKEFYIDKNGNRVRNDFAKSIKKLEGQKRAKAKEKLKDLILTEGVDIIIERMRKNNITSIDLQKLDNDWGYGTISPEYEEVYLTLKLNDDGSLYYIAQGYGFEDGELYLYDKPDDEEIVDSNISDKLLDYLKELAEDSLDIEGDDYIGEYEGEGEADINEIRYRL